VPRQPVFLFDSIIADFNARQPAVVQGEAGSLLLLVAASDLQRSRGVRGMALDDVDGMLFDAGRMVAEGFSMTDVPFGLEVAWVGADRRVIAVTKLDPDSGVTAAPGPYRWAIEAKPGVLAAAGVVPGAAVWIDL
jgi:uncharacterized membrane protein (UPF0127 family)